MQGAKNVKPLFVGGMPSFSRPSVSDDNPFSESLCRTRKYRPFENLDIEEVALNKGKNTKMPTTDVKIAAGSGCLTTSRNLWQTIFFRVVNEKRGEKQPSLFSLGDNLINIYRNGGWRYCSKF